MFFAKKVTSKGGFSVFFLDICHANDKLPTFKINFKDEKKLKILNFVDVLIDGRFEIDKRNISLKYRGSSNQRVIDLKKSRIENKVIEIAGI